MEKFELFETTVDKKVEELSKHLSQINSDLLQMKDHLKNLRKTIKTKTIEQVRFQAAIESYSSSTQLCKEINQKAESNVVPIDANATVRNVYDHQPVAQDS